ncbi:hypothetical protein [Streptomyces sp. NBC_00887]|uniref:hypothetical protein n=1 Tax=Streptomyces sp. NBC_00887 TaxID=2975859 RepID=UPI003869463A|nr:hypothetical protein OG844_27760 [Streptomyces sp. NBC_00887]
MAATPNQQTDLRKVFYQCRLGRDDLERMFNMACEGIDSPTIEVSTVSGSTRFWETTISSLVTTVQSQSTESGDDWTNLELKAESPGRERTVSIKIATDRTEYDVSGSDAVWAYGQSARIENFLTRRGAVKKSPKYEAKISFGFIFVFLIIGTFFVIAESGPDTVSECLDKAKRVQEDAPLVNAIFATLMTLGLAGAIIPLLKRRALRARLQVSSNISSGGWWHHLSAAEKIAAIGIPIAVAAAAGAVMSGFSDVFGK